MTSNYLPIDYNDREYAPIELLLHGDVDIWLRRRDALLKEKSKHTGFEAEASKLLSAGVGVGALLASANPLAWLPMAIAAGGYLYTVFREYQDTGSIRPLPLFRGNLGDVLIMMEGRTVEGRHPLLNEIEYLTEAEKDEALLLNYRFGELAGLLKSAPERTRFDLYRHICNQFFARKDLIGADEVKLYLANAVSPTRLQPLPQAPAAEIEDTNPFPAFQSQESPTPPPTVEVPAAAIGNYQPSPSTHFSVSQSFAATLRSMFVLGCPGVGKGLIISIAWREVKKLFPDLIVYVIDPKNSEREKGYWEGVDYHNGLSVDSLLISRPDKATWLRDRLVEFDSLPSPKLLIVDELVALSKNLGSYPDSKEAYTTLTDYAVSIVSSGQSEGRFVWLITQSPNLSTLKIDGGDATIFPGVLLYRDGIDNEAWLKSTARCTLGSAVTIDPDEIFRAASNSPRRAIAFDTRQKKWQSVPALENHSGFNRDEYLQTLKSESKGTNWDNEIAILNQRSKAIAVEVPEVEVDPLTDWDNGYEVTDDAFLEVLEFIRGKYGTDSINPSEVHRSQTAIRKLYDGKVDNLKALLFRAVREELAILDRDDKGSPIIRIL